MSEVTNPHDKFFREMWSRQEVARDFLANYLPDDVLQYVHLESLQIEKDSFVDEHLREQFSDLLYRVGLSEGKDGFVYMLFEHKSYPDRFVAVQLLRYMGGQFGSSG